MGHVTSKEDVGTARGVVDRLVQVVTLEHKVIDNITSLMGAASLVAAWTGPLVQPKQIPDEGIREERSHCVLRSPPPT